MKNKKIILLLLSFVMCGCTARYNLDISDGKIKETATIYATSTETYVGDNTANLLKYAAGSPRVSLNLKNKNVYDNLGQVSEVSGVDYYDMSFNDNTLIATTKYNIEHFRKAVETPAYVALFESSNRNDIQTIKFSNINSFGTYNTLDNLVVTINTDYKVTYTNADSVNGNTYTWNVNRSNYSKKVIEISFEYKSTESQSSEEKTNEGTTATLMLIGIMVCLVLLAGVVYLFITSRSLKANKL